MESVTMLSHNAIPPTLPPKTKPRTSLQACETNEYYESDCGNPGTAATLTGSKAVSAASSSHTASRSTVFLAGDQQQATAPHSVGNAPRNGHVVTIRINPTSYPNNPDTASPKDEHRALIVNGEERSTFRSNTKVNLNQSPINTIGKFIVNICESNSTEDQHNDAYLNSQNNTSNSCVRINIGSDTNNLTERSSDEMVQKSETIMKTATNNGSMNNAYFFCNAFPCSPTNLMSSGQCSPSDTLDSGTCSDLDGTPPPLPKKKNSKANGTGHKRVSVTVIGATAHRAPSVTSSGAEVDSEDSESNISCDSLNSSELSAASLHEESATVTFKSDILKAAILNSERRKSDTADQVDSAPPAAPIMPAFFNNTQSSGGFLPQGLLQDIRERSAKLSTVPVIQETVNKTSWAELDIEKKSEPVQEPIPFKREIMVIPEEKLTSFKLVSQVNNENKKPRVTDVIYSHNVIQEATVPYSKMLPIVNESTYVDRKLEQEKQKQDNLYSCNFLYDTDKYYNFHLNENVFDNDSDTDKKSKKKGVVNGKDVCINGSSESELYDVESMEYFAGIKDFKNEDSSPSTIRSAKGTIRGVKNRVRAGIATFLQIQNSPTTKVC